MNRYFIVLLLTVLVSNSVLGQDKKEVLLTIDGSPVYVSEFKRVYNKNLELVQDESQKSVDGYLDLFIDYKLKAAEAYAQNLDETRAYKNEFRKYQEQLSRNYIFENKVTEDLAREAFERGKEEINADHILIQVGYDAVPQDTLKAYNKIKEIRKKAVAGEDFEQLAKQYSEEPGAKERAGKLGYFSVFSMVYPFETGAYNTQEGEVSEIIRTRFGYHIIKVLDRREREPKISVSHIMISDNAGARTFDPEERINEVYAMLQQGKAFEDLAKQYSDDKNSAVKGGQLSPFAKGDLKSDKFETAAYNLKKPGDVSKPIKSEFGWHIIRLDSVLGKPTFEEEKDYLEKRVKEGSRSKIVSHAVNNKIKEKYGFSQKNNYSPFFNEFVTDEVMNRRWKYDTLPPSQDKVLFTIGERNVMYSDFAEYISERQRRMQLAKTKFKVISDMYDEFETQALKDYFRYKLEDENEQYAAVISEYRDGLLIFDLMEKNVWNKAKSDSVGLQKFYETHKKEYKWKKRYDVEIISATNKKTAQQAAKLFKKGKTGDEIKAQLNQGDTVNVILTTGMFEKGERELPMDFKGKKGVSEVYHQNDSYIVVNVKRTIPAGIKPLEQARGRVLSDYQNHIEKKWMESLHDKYNVTINKKALKGVKEALQG
ncbi:peptidylprolyl isomerase [Marixanthomonas spongiae]|uniref:peptidylprolyl isomerase n=1 Tax=Marixanthomonas spongiae TaxID=2174845 RepID=A0A2U0HWH9_9FLAO|nr:peptidylprolyl isomerase [Marixanthomonas spongiae]PVW13100.1 peptidylprolyl isomerase [Marixanthomonas spongiae]